MKIPKPDLDTRGTVTVKDNKYKIKGNFHFGYAPTPIREADTGQLVGVTKPRDITHIHSYGGEWPFFDGIANGKLLATKCENPDCEHTGTVWEPFRIRCADCLMPTTILDITSKARETAKLYSFMVIERSGAFNVLDKPIRFINVEFEGVETILMSYLLCGEPKIGMRVVPIFRTKAPTYLILDLAFVPEGTKEADLPEDFTFGA
ncbi:MAG: Zn-ribbon domain-containing OB-fold protein [Planctomycetota bacterium]|jgi:uncharacterized OB-fold protein